MKLKIFTFRFSTVADGFDDAPLRDFILDKEVVDFTEHFFEHERTPYLTVVLAYRDLAPDEKRSTRRREAPEKELSAEERSVFDALRNWRAGRARADGIPPYMIANNRQFTRIVMLRACSKADLAKVNGVGERKIARYGDDILAVLAAHPGSSSAPPPSSDREAQA